MADLADYKSSLEHIVQLYTILLADYQERLKGITRSHSSAELAEAVSGFAKVGTKLHKFFLEDAPSVSPLVAKAQLFRERSTRVEALSELDLPQPNQGSFDEDTKDIYAYYLAGAGVTPDNLSTLVSTHRWPELTSRWTTDIEQEQNAINPFAAGTGDIDIIGRAKNWNGIFNRLSDDKVSVSTRLDTTINLPFPNARWVASSYLAGYGVTASMLDDPNAKPLLDALAGALTSWVTTYQETITMEDDYGEYMALQALIAGMEAVGRAST